MFHAVVQIIDDLKQRFHSLAVVVQAGAVRFEEDDWPKAINHNPTPTQHSTLVSLNVDLKNVATCDFVHIVEALFFDLHPWLSGMLIIGHEMVPNLAAFDLASRCLSCEALNRNYLAAGIDRDMVLKYVESFWAWFNGVGYRFRITREDQRESTVARSHIYQKLLAFAQAHESFHFFDRAIRTCIVRFFAAFFEVIETGALDIVDVKLIAVKIVRRHFRT